MYTTEQIADSIITASIQQNRTVRLVYETDLAARLSFLSDDSTETPEYVEYWGMATGAPVEGEWRVFLSK